MNSTLAGARAKLTNSDMRAAKEAPALATKTEMGSPAPEIASPELEINSPELELKPVEEARAKSMAKPSAAPINDAQDDASLKAAKMDQASSTVGTAVAE